MDYLFSYDEMEGIYFSDENSEASDTETKIQKPYWKLRGELASCACTSGNGNTLSSLTDLCKILRPYGFDNLHSDSHALLKTPRDSLVRDVFPGQYVHIGLKIGIEFQLKQNSVDVNQITCLVVDCDMDSVRVCKSMLNNTTFWPI